MYKTHDDTLVYYWPKDVQNTEQIGLVLTQRRAKHKMRRALNTDPKEQQNNNNNNNNNTHYFLHPVTNRHHSASEPNCPISL